ncbi:MAG TPA: serine acetyltransferase [Acidimicrobiales bacterium]|nr:serine acetyltransferase [Acidimicrobiales bacterium]
MTAPLPFAESVRADLRRNHGTTGVRSLVRALVLDVRFRALVTLRALQAAQHLEAGPVVLGLLRLLHLRACNRAGVELPAAAIGAALRINHGWGLVVNQRARLGSNVTLHQGVTIGVRNRAAPAIEDEVWIGAGAIVLGGITIGRGALIGAGAVVMQDVAPGDIVVGNPQRVVGRRESAAVYNRWTRSP